MHTAQVDFLDLDMTFQRVMTRNGTTVRVLFRPYRKPGNARAYAYISFTSFHGRHTSRGWVLAELPSLRLMTHNSTPELWKEEGSVFYDHLCSRGYPQCFLRTVLQEVTWTRRSELLKGSRQKKNNEFFETYLASGFVLTLRNAPEWPQAMPVLNFGRSYWT